ncbi:G-protein coupled receptor 176 isoform X1 [Alosa sapidissima]|uniref:G-protein coupled receptor 176 isoform X1 n=1 Tax=Alosa sapidissima TaxID=34773 RepID=UPI001C0A35B5|nr:G-protein coupled receptor 176 isoform X1 [Alosa sapidissima]XP_041951525.1 G-protein coupled receptor 176 isoform X1 [Alosa sapidissima]
MDVDSFGRWVASVENGTVNLTASANTQIKVPNTSLQMDPWEEIHSTEVTRLENRYFIQEQTYRDFTTTVQILILIGSLLGNASVLWCTCYTNVFKPVTGRFIKNLACSGVCATLVCVPFDLLLGSSPHCCGWLRVLFLCKAVRFLQRLFCSVTVLSFTAIALDRYYSVLYPLERKISDAKSRDLVIYIWVHAVVASAPVLVVTDVTDIYATSSCLVRPSHTLGHLVYVVSYNVTTVIAPLAAVFLAMVLIRRALSASQKKKVIIAALRTPQNCISIPYVSQREAELHATLLAAVLAFTLSAVPYAALVGYQVLALGAQARAGQGGIGGPAVPAALRLTAAWLPKLSLLTNPLLLLTVNRSARHCLADLLVRAHRRCSRRNAVSTAGLGEVGSAGGAGVGSGGEAAARSGSQLLEMFNIGQQQIFRPSEEEDEEEEEEEGRHEIPSVGSGGFQHRFDETAAAAGSSGRAAASVGPELTHQHQLHPATGAREVGLPPPKSPPVQQSCAYSSSQVAPATPTEPEEATQFGFGPFELPPQWLPETRNSKRRLLPPLGNTPEELIQTKQPRTRPERRISRNNKVSTFPVVDP